MNKYKNIVWDWNGTLLDDLQVGVLTLNKMLEHRNLLPLTTADYKDNFGFPVNDFYEKIGFDFSKESLHDISVEFVEVYESYEHKSRLNPEAMEVLGNMKDNGKRQYILSALREKMLKHEVDHLGIDSFFTAVYGSDNIYAEGKIARGKQFVTETGIIPSETVMIGDTLHDAEVASALGFDCILYSGGHNSRSRLEATGLPVVDSLKDVKDLLI
ncbi:MAG: HAD family hydrolase [Culturomica sp.]|nr:HAD family hydrolase [Culturomica sp.]